MDWELQSLLLGFALTTVAGGFVGAWFQRLAWRRQALLDQAKQSYRDLTAMYEAVTLLIDSRYYALFKWNQAVYEGLHEDELKRRIDAYYVIVAEWNNRLRLTHNQLRINLGEESALAFLNYADDFDQHNAKSLHYRFLRATRILRLATADREHLPEATEEMHQLNWALTAFANDTADELEDRARHLATLRPRRSPRPRPNGLLVSGPEHPGLAKSLGTPAAR